MKKEFIDNYLFNEFKDVPFDGAKRFVKLCVDKFDIIPDSDLYRRIINYQIQEYGMSLTRHLTKSNYYSYYNNRKKHNDKANEYHEFERFLKRNEKEINQLGSEQND